MKQRQRRLLGIVATVVFLILYVLVAMAAAGDWIVGHGIVIELLGYMVLGVAWLPVAMVLIKWMSRPDLPRS